MAGNDVDGLAADVLPGTVWGVAGAPVNAPGTAADATADAADASSEPKARPASPRDLENSLLDAINAGTEEGK